MCLNVGQEVFKVWIFTILHFSLEYLPMALSLRDFKNNFYIIMYFKWSFQDNQRL